VSASVAEWMGGREMVEGKSIYSYIAEFCMNHLSHRVVSRSGVVNR
jgi:hypothetical protein